MKVKSKSSTSLLNFEKHTLLYLCFCAANLITVLSPIMKIIALGTKRSAKYLSLQCENFVKISPNESLKIDKILIINNIYLIPRTSLRDQAHRYYRQPTGLSNGILIKQGTTVVTNKTETEWNLRTYRKHDIVRENCSLRSRFSQHVTRVLQVLSVLLKVLPLFPAEILSRVSNAAC